MTANDLKTDKTCPDCGGALYVTEAVRSTPYIEAFHVVGREMPRKYDDVVVACCCDCEYTEVLGMVKK